MNPNVAPSVATIIATVFRVAEESVVPDSSPDSISAWDSLGHFQLIAALETAFSVKFNMREIQAMDSAARVESILAKRGVLTTA